MSKIRELLTLQEEIFCRWYMQTLDKVLSAYNAGYLDNLKEKKTFDKLTLTENKNLHRQANQCLKRKIVHSKILELTDELAKKSGKATLDECLAFVTAVMRKAAYENFEDEKTINQGLRACEMMLKHYPSYEGGANSDEDKYTFARIRQK